MQIVWNIKSAETNIITKNMCNFKRFFFYIVYIYIYIYIYINAFTWMLIELNSCVLKKKSSLKFVNQFLYSSRHISSMESDTSIYLAKASATINYMEIWSVSVLLYGCTTWMLTKHREKKLDENNTKMQCAILNKSLKQHLTKEKLYAHLHPISQNIQDKQDMWSTAGELISDVLL